MCTTELPPRLYVDGHNLLHRAAFSFPARITSRSGRDITLVFGFFALIRKLDRLTGRIGHLIRDQWDDPLLRRALIQLRTDVSVSTAIGTPRPGNFPSAPDIIGALDLWK